MTLAPLLTRQLCSASLCGEAVPTLAEWQTFLATVERTYGAAEQELARERDKLKTTIMVHEAILDAAFDGVMITDAANAVVRVSARLLSMWGTTETALGSGPHRVLALAEKTVDPAAFLEATARIFADPHSGHQDEVVLADGRTLERTSTPIPAEDGGTHGRVWFFRDITVRMLQETQDRQISAEQHRFLFDASPLPLWVFEPATLRFLAVNEAMIQLVGYSRDELLAMNLRDLVPPDSLHEVVHGVEGIAVGTIQHIGVRPYRCKSGKLVLVDITGHAMSFEGRRVQLAIGIDVTQQRQMEEQLRQAMKMEAIGQLAGGVAHDFNNILAVILANAEMVIEDTGPDSGSHEDLLEIEAAAMRAAALTRQLLTFSRQQPREVTVIAMNAIVINLEKMLSRIVGEDIAISALLCGQLGAIRADVGQLEQVVMNLVVNARDAMPSGGRLSIETSNAELDELEATQLGVPPGRYVKLSVTDTGCGMSAATRARIFEPFFTTKRVGKGTGLGLSTVFGIVRQSEGAILVTSKLGSGTTFQVLFPRCESLDDLTVVTARVPVTASRSGRVLVIEDDERLRAVLQRRLTSWGYSMTVAADGETALAMLSGAEQPFDLIMTDLVMPGVDGRTLATRILAETPDAKILFMSGYSDHAAVKTSAIGPHEHFIAKPFTSQELANAIDRTLGARAAC